MDKKRLVDGTTALAEKRPRVIKIEPAERPQNVRLRVAAYTRVSSDSEDQLNSFAAQNRYYTELISGKAEWRMVDIYADEGITGTSVAKRDDFQRMMADCRRGLIDQILVKSIYKAELAAWKRTCNISNGLVTLIFSTNNNIKIVVADHYTYILLILINHMLHICSIITVYGIT